MTRGHQNIAWPLGPDCAIIFQLKRNFLKVLFLEISFIFTHIEIQILAEPVFLLSILIL